MTKPVKKPEQAVEAIEPEPKVEWDRAANIHVRMIRAQAEAKKLEKTKPAEGSEGAKFLKNGYVAHDVVTHEAVRILTAHGIHFQPYLKSHAQDGNRTVIDMEGVFTNVDNPEERLTFLGFGYGVDGSDKGPGKAMSYAKKMVLTQALMLNTHEDIETHNTDYKPNGGERITAKEVADLKTLLENAGVDVEVIYEAYTVKDLVDLTPAQLKNARARTQKKMELGR